jgi:hypothetical protein
VDTHVDHLLDAFASSVIKEQACDEEGNSVSYKYSRAAARALVGSVGQCYLVLLEEWNISREIILRLLVQKITHDGHEELGGANGRKRCL